MLQDGAYRLRLPNRHPEPDLTARTCLELSSSKLQQQVMDMLNRMRLKEELCDVVLIVGNRQIKAHKVVLAAFSPYFKAMFTSDLLESRLNQVTMRDVDENALESMIVFAYTSSIRVDESNVQALLPCACLLQIEEIRDSCCEFLKTQLDPSNCLGVRAFADAHSCSDLFHHANRYVMSYFEEVSQSEEFVVLPVDQVIDIISNDELDVSSEEKVYHAVMSWVSHDPSVRRLHLAEILQHVRLIFVSARFLVSVVCADVLIKNDAKCRDIVDEAKNYFLLPEQRTSMQGRISQPRRPMLPGEVLFAVGGWCSGDAISSVERYDPSVNKWTLVSCMCKRRCGVGVAVLGDMLYAVGGHDGSSYLNTVERYDPKSNTWRSDVTCTSTSRTSVGVAVLDGFLYAVGGQDGVSCLNIVERYDPNMNRWSQVSNMCSQRLGVAVAVLDGCLYAIGGSDGTSPLNTAERYTPKTNTWEFIPPMSVHRKHLGAAALDGCIYAVGGRDSCSELTSVERYDPKNNAWYPAASLNSRRSGVGLAVVNNKLIAVGGFDGNMYLKTAEEYDSAYSKWQFVSNMCYRRLGGGLGVMRAPQESASVHSPSTQDVFR